MKEEEEANNFIILININRKNLIIFSHTTLKIIRRITKIISPQL